MCILDKGNEDNASIKTTFSKQRSNALDDIDEEKEKEDGGEKFVIDDDMIDEI